ncbi:hypothetical protein PV327_005020 [Microctonus hyperodae]|uniref:Uncharacterized protein n=1 Tax=Microctonus hyperodae TaxID=165561 RepID=A0AA39KN77_MICHY|nr:hypothetical protein PV327_005020 [Microctonus hyperodae]
MPIKIRPHNINIKRWLKKIGRSTKKDSYRISIYPLFRKLFMIKVALPEKLLIFGETSKIISHTVSFAFKRLEKFLLQICTALRLHIKWDTCYKKSVSVPNGLL